MPPMPKIPEMPKEIKISNIKEIIAKIDKIVAKMPKEVVVKRSMLDQFERAPKVNITTDVKPFVKAIEELRDELQLNLKVFVEKAQPDFEPVIEAINKTTHSLDTLEFPVPTFNSALPENAATETTLQAINNKTLDLDSYAYFGAAEDATFHYIGRQDRDGRWVILRINKTTRDGLYANGVSGMVTAWANRATQTYREYAEAF